MSQVDSTQDEAWAMVRILWYVLVILAVGSVAGYARCEDVQFPQVQSRALILEGVRGRWFELGVAGTLLEAKEQIPELKALVADLERKSVLLDQRLTIRTERIKLYQEASALAELRAAELEKQLRAQSAELTKERSLARSPMLWFGLGSGSVAVLAVLLSSLAH